VWNAANPLTGERNGKEIGIMYNFAAKSAGVSIEENQKRVTKS
jgi:hypothetical protein